MNEITYKEAPLKVLQALGYTLEQVNHCALQLPDMLEEAVKRIKYSPFDLDISMRVLCTPGKYSHVLSYIADQVFKPWEDDYLCSIDDKPDMDLSNVATLVSCLTAANPTADPLMEVRGKSWPRANMPLYLDEGEKGKQYIYPIFDWSELQIWSAIFAYDLANNIGPPIVEFEELK